MAKCLNVVQDTGPCQTLCDVRNRPCLKTVENENSVVLCSSIVYALVVVVIVRIWTLTLFKWK